jgi:hypothetical protein
MPCINNAIVFCELFSSKRVWARPHRRRPFTTSSQEYNNGRPMSTPPPLNSRIAQAIAAYRAGRARPVRMSDGASGELFRARSQALIASHLSAAEHGAYAQVRDQARAAVDLIHAGDTAAARQGFRTADAFLDGLAVSEECRLLCRSWIDQGEAYLDAREGAWDRARRRLDAAMASDHALETRYGYELFHIGRVHVLHLRLRVEAGAGELQRAIDLARAIADYLWGDREDMPHGEGWSRSSAAAVPEDLRWAMTARIAGEVGTQLALCPAARAAELFARVPVWRRFEDHPVLDEIFRWGVAEQAYLAADSACFLALAVPMLAAGRGETSLWYVTALELCRTCAGLRADATRAFLDEVAADAGDWSDLPAAFLPGALRSRLARCRDDAPRCGYRHRPPERRFHLINVGLPRCGTSSVYSLFARFRAGNEFMERETVSRCVQHRRGELDDSGFLAFLRRRDREGALEVDSASFNHLYLDVLLDELPEAKFLFLIRDPYGWTGSYLKMLRRWLGRYAERGEEPPRWMGDYGTLLLGEFSWRALASPASLEADLPSLAERFVRHWADANRRLFDLLPEDRSLMIRTHELSQRRHEIAALCGVDPRQLADEHHSNASPDRDDPLRGLEPGLFAGLCARHAADVLARAGFDPAGSQRP